ncbi:unnamed protein product [Vitrella brassicaformis CCMP3155]|uniref:Uncharacterized protein n=1 Tax=Vitrella brassicaformis (strain CCMP3155) TaxID=1169540 RepID=A0A0G4GXS0_VITBC|nr:unnamed protein product [Vitrella brassicaformis CCMP3155]|eukprot:CEM35649.1 unnamed protein product [Vitrella brassicaformis CCMP3155]
MDGSQRLALPVVLISPAVSEKLRKAPDLLGHIRWLLSDDDAFCSNFRDGLIHDGRLWIRRIAGSCEHFAQLDGLHMTLEEVVIRIVRLFLEHGGVANGLRVLLPHPPDHTLIPSSESDTPFGSRHVLRAICGVKASSIAAKWLSLGVMMTRCSRASLDSWLLDKYPGCTELLAERVGSMRSAADGLIVNVKDIIEDMAQPQSGAGSSGGHIGEMEIRIDRLVAAVLPKSFVLLAFEKPASQQPDSRAQVEGRVRSYALALARRCPDLVVLLLPCPSPEDINAAIVRFLRRQQKYNNQHVCRVYWACGVGSDAMLLSLARAVRPTAAHIYILRTLQQASGALEVVHINRLRDALYDHVQAQVSSLGVDQSRFDIGQCVRDLCIIWAWATSKVVASPIGGPQDMGVGKKLDAITRAYFSHLHDRCGEIRPSVFTGRDINCKALADLINTITPASQALTTTDDANQQISSYVDALKALAAFYHGKRSHPPPVCPFDSPPDLNSIAQALDLGRVPSDVSGAFSSHRSGYEMDVVVSAFHHLADYLQQHPQQGVELRVASHGLNGRLEKSQVETNTAADDAGGVVDGQLTSQKPTPPPPAPPSPSPFLLIQRLACVPGLFWHLIDMLAMKDTWRMAALCHALYNAIYTFITIVNFANPDHGSVVQGHRDLVSQAVVLLPREMDKVAKDVLRQLAAFCRRRLSLRAAVLKELFIVDVTHKIDKRHRTGEETARLPVDRPGEGPSNDKAMPRLEALNVNSVAAFSIFESLELWCPKMTFLTARPLTFPRRNLDATFSSFCSRHPTLQHVDVDTLWPSMLGELEGLNLTYVGNIHLDLDNWDGPLGLNDWHHSWPETGWDASEDVVSFIKDIKQRHGDDRVERTMVVETPILIDLSLPTVLASPTNSVRSPRPLRLLSFAERTAGP